MSDVIESFLVSGGPDKPESRSNKDSLWDAIKERDELLEELRTVLLGVVANKFASMANVDSVPIVYRCFKNNSKDTTEFINQVGIHNIVHITCVSSLGLKASENTDSGVLFTIFYTKVGIE